MGDAMREPGRYAIIDGRELHVTGVDGDEVWVDDGGRRRPVPRDAVELVTVSVTARWYGEQVAVTGYSGAGVGIATMSRALAEREGLAGDQHRGWHGEATLDVLTDLEEQVRAVPRRKP